MTGDQIDKAWFSQQLKRKGKSQADLARFLDLDRSAVTRMLNGDRHMSVEEQDRIAEYLEIPVGDVALHRRGGAAGFSENNQTAYSGPAPSARSGPEAGNTGAAESRHPIFGCMKGTITVMPDVDLTEPVDFEWGEKLYNE